MFRAFLCQSGFGVSRKSTTLKLLDPVLPFPLSRTFCTSNPNTFAVSYLINNLGFSPESALKASKHARFKTSEKPDSVVTFFRNHGFTESDTRSIITRQPSLLSCKVDKRVLPKFQFLQSIGASSSDIVRIVTSNPKFMESSLENSVIPAYNLVYRFHQSEKKTLASVIRCPSLLCSLYFELNVKLLGDNGVASSSISRILSLSPRVLCSSYLEKTVQELKDMGFDPSKAYFSLAMVAKRGMSKSKWDEKVDTFKKWGWSEEAILEAFKKHPLCMVASNDKINRVMLFWVNQLGWDSSYLMKQPCIFSYSLENRVIPRASVVHCLLSKGLRSERISLTSPFLITEKLFLKRYVTCFEEEESSQLLKLYLGKMRTQGNRDVSCS